MPQSQQKQQNKQASFRNKQSANDQYKQTMLDNLKRDAQYLTPQQFQAIHSYSTPKQAHTANLRGLRVIAGKNIYRQNRILGDLTTSRKHDEHIYTQKEDSGIIETKSSVSCSQGRVTGVVADDSIKVAHKDIAHYLKQLHFFEFSKVASNRKTKPCHLSKDIHFETP